MSRRPPELFARDLKYLVRADPPHHKRRSGTHSHWLATAVIAVLVGAWLGGDPSASIDVESEKTSNDVEIATLADQIALDLSDIWPDDPVGVGLPPSGLTHAPLPGLDFGPHRERAHTPPTTQTPEIAPDSVALGTGEPGVSEAAREPMFVPPSLELAVGFEEQQSDIELFAVDTRFNLTAMDVAAGSGWNVIDIKKGDTLSAIFKQLGVDPEVTHNLTRDDNGKLLNNLATGPNLKIRFNRDGALEAVRYNVDAVRILVASVEGRQVSSHIEKRTIEVREREVAARIRSSLFQAGAEAGLSDQFVLRLAAIFKWNIDFNRDLQPGDRFSVIFEEKFIDDRKIATGGIVAAAFQVGERKHTAVRHVESDGTVSYFSAEGESLKRAFLRSPVKFSRISSKFSPNRFHPVLKRWRAHKGVDYAAARGTPVLATADGAIVRIGRNGGYGNAVVLQHGKSYSTVYAHLDGFAKKLRKGDRVRQGQVIGFVGSSGLATGPHLHYEFQVNGEHKDPLTVNVPRALPIAGDERDNFLRVARDFDRKLTALLN